MDNPTIQKFFQSTDLTNKTIVTLVIRMTLRLSLKYGNSLSRLTHLIEGLTAEDAPHKVSVSVPVREMPEAEEPSGSIQSESDVVKRLKNLAKKGDAMIAERKKEEEGETVVQTNPALADFL